MENSDLIYRIAFASLRGMGYELAQRILDVLPSEKDFFFLPQKELQDMLQSKNKITETNYRHQQLDKATKELDFITNNNIGITYFTDDSFPNKLTNTNDAPIILYSKGDCNFNASKIISIVGTRHATPYGMHICESLVSDLATQLGKNIIIVSGLAYGIDICAHRAAISAGVPTAAVMAHGLNTIYPSSHRNDAIDIIHHGGILLTDYQSQDRIHPSNFIARNRIVAGLADCTVVIESAQKGGALITANLAYGYNRDVFAIPGRCNDPYSIGCNHLIRKNIAALITDASELISAMRWKPCDTVQQPRQMEIFPDLSSDEQAIISYLTNHGETHINPLGVALSLPMSQLMSALIELEFNGHIISLPGARYTLA